MGEFGFVRARNLGLSVIPIINKTGRPAPTVTEWGSFVFKLPPEDLCDVWDMKYPIGEQFGIAVIAGPASGLSWLDLDTNNPTSHSVAPSSAYSKAGIPGRDTRFFKWNELYEKQSNIGELRDGKQCAILFQNHYTIIPPSIRRPDHTGICHKYVWTKKSLWDLEDRSELSLMPDPSWHNDLPIIDETAFVETNSGRNNKLKSMVYAGYAKGKSDKDICREIIEYDFTAHTKPLFTDRDEGFTSNSEYETFQNARRFVLSNIQSALRQKIEVNMEPDPEFILDDNIYVFKPKVLPAPYPGVLSLFCDVARTSLQKANGIALLGAALSLMSHLSRHRIVTNRLQPNLINLIVSPSGNGKSSACDLLEDALKAKPEDFVKSSYKSGAAFVETAKLKPIALHIIDEARPFLSAMKSNESYSSDLIEMVNGLYSSTNRIYQMPMTAARAKDPGEYAIKYPYLNICGFTHFAGFRAGMSKYLAESGFLARTLLFWDHGTWDEINNADYSRVLELRSFVSEYEKILDAVYPIKRASGYVMMSNEYYEYLPTEIKFDKQAKDLLFGYTRDKSKVARTEDSEIIQSLLVRHAELAIKLSQLAFMSNLVESEITRDHLEWGISVVETLFYNMRPEIDVIDAPDDLFSRKSVQAIQYLRSRGPTSCARLQQILHVDEGMFAKISKYLKVTGQASEVKHGRGSRLVAVSSCFASNADL